MKRRILSLICGILLFCQPDLFPKVIPMQDALKVLTLWIEVENSLPYLRIKENNIKFSSISDLTFKNEKIGYMVQLYPEGFIIISRISELSPVKFISFSGQYEEISTHPFIRHILKRLYYSCQKLGYITSAPLILSPSEVDPIDLDQKHKNEAVWANFLSDNKRVFDTPVSAVPPKLQSTWNQGIPTATGNAYNMYTPTVGENHTYTGCSATAQAQVMFFWKYPSMGQGSYTYNWYGQVLDADFQHYYNWNHMLDNYSGSETAEQKDAVARLMLDVGISIHTNFGVSGSSAVPNDNNSLHVFFKYSPDISRVYRRNQGSWEAWFNIFQDQLDKGWPAILSTFKNPYTLGGHAVVIDGYRELGGENQVHVNMGWGGYADNYYTLDDIYDYGNENIDYAIINIHPHHLMNYVFGGNDYNGDGTTDITVFRPVNGFWYIRNQVTCQWGLSSDIPVPGDYNGDGSTDIAVFRPANGFWYVKDQTTCQWGLSSDIPVPGDYNGDGAIDIAVFRPANGFWYVKDQAACQWGLCDDIPLVR